MKSQQTKSTKHAQQLKIKHNNIFFGYLMEDTVTTVESKVSQINELSKKLLEYLQNQPIKITANEELKKIQDLTNEYLSIKQK